MEGFINSATEDYEIGFIDPALTVLQGNYPLYMVDPTRATHISGARDKNSAIIGKIYTIDPGIVLADGSAYTPPTTEASGDEDAKPAPPRIRLHKDEIPLVQQRPYQGKILSAFPPGQSFSMEAPESLEDGKLIFSHWEGLDGLISESDKTQPSVLVTMPERRITPRAVYTEPKPEPIDPVEPVEPEPQPDPTPVEPVKPIEPQPTPEPIEPVKPQPSPQIDYPLDDTEDFIVDKSPKQKELPKTGDYSSNTLVKLLSLSALSLFFVGLAARLRAYRTGRNL